ncbi:MAG: PilT protein domain protein [Ilumatobacteraceae bacterium]|nr:PilT protein domain protein [Ilumatobacteraceae bacterium]
MGLTHLDAGVIIGFLDANDAHHDNARAALRDALRDGDHLALAASALAECLVGPSRRGEGAVRAVQDFIERIPISIVPLDVEIATIAARLRAAHRALRLPDALVISTAIERTADRVVTTDRKWPSAKSLGFGGEIRRL